MNKRHPSRMLLSLPKMPTCLRLRLRRNLPRLKRPRTLKPLLNKMMTRLRWKWKPTTKSRHKTMRRWRRRKRPSPMTKLSKRMPRSQRKKPQLLKPLNRCKTMPTKRSKTME